MNSEILDARLHHWLRKKIGELPISQQIQLKNLKNCGKTAMIQPQSTPAVFLLRNNRNEARLFGQVTCKNTWACPHCSTVRMQKYAKIIGAAIESMKLNYHQRACMITFTVPHLRFQSCREVTDILYKTWTAVFQNAHSRRKTKNGDSIRSSSPANKFFSENEIRHYVRVAEYTWGANGWHPHFHCLFWFPEKYLDNILSFEQSIQAFWTKKFKEVVSKYYKNRDEFNAIQKLHDIADDDYAGKQDIVWISKGKDGKIMPVESADYIAGWGADNELTGNYRKNASNEGHYTPYQILEMAADGNKQMEDLYVEFMLQVTRKPVHHRINFSKTGILKIAKIYMNTVGFEQLLKKKSAEWEVVAWFNQEQWSEICHLDLLSPFISNILYLAAINRRDLLSDFLENFGIKLAKCPHFHQQHVENIFNNVA